MAAEGTEENQDQSMEEILQSIKRIIAEENDGDEEGGAESSVKGSDVLELTDIVEEGDGDAPVTNDSIDDIMAAADAAPAPEPEPEPQAEAAAPSPAPAMDDEPTQDVLDDIDSLLSSETKQNSAAALQSLAALSDKPKPAAKKGDPGMNFRSGETVEDLVLEALRPMLKQWLDSNLTGIVEELVEKEIKKLTQ